MVAFDGDGFQFVPHITLGQVLETSAIVLGFALSIIRKYLRSEEDSEDLRTQGNLIAEMRTSQLQMANIQQAQQEMMKRQEARIDRVENHLFFGGKGN